MIFRTLVYNTLIFLYEGTIKLVSPWVPKAKLWVCGRRGQSGKIREAIAPEDRVFWLHAASVGEFEQGRPILEYIREHHPEYKILLTFYSPSGYELRKNYKGVDWVFYFPSDKPLAARRFIKAIHPKIAVFVKYEIWLNTLSELEKAGTKTYLISAIFNRNSIFFNSYWGEPMRRGLKTFETIFVQNEESEQLLRSIGLERVCVAGDTRFDRVADIVNKASGIETVSRFCESGRRCFVAGSTWGPDEEILLPLIKENPDIKFIIAPHEMDKTRIERIMQQTRACRYTQAPENIHEFQVLIIDTIGLLSTIYRYASWVYIGGGFGAGIHNTVEPASYGLPLAFGPKYHKFAEAEAMVERGIARSVNGALQLSEWFASLKENEELRANVCRKAVEYTGSQLGATCKIINTMGL